MNHKLKKTALEAQNNPIIFEIMISFNELEQPMFYFMKESNDLSKLK